jgi:hypothetical protein
MQIHKKNIMGSLYKHWWEKNVASRMCKMSMDCHGKWQIQEKTSNDDQPCSHGHLHTPEFSTVMGEHVFFLNFVM